MPRNKPFSPAAFALALALPLGLGFLSGLLTSNDVSLYTSLNLPPLAPPGAVFGPVWALLYALMGLGSYLAFSKGGPLSGRTLLCYGLQLVLLFFWPLFFFKWSMPLVALLLLVLLFVVSLCTARQFYKAAPIAGLLQLPYLLWLLFAGYLNLAIVLLN